MSFLQTPDERSVLLLGASGGLDGLGSFQTSEHTDLSQIILTVLKSGVAGGSERIRLRLYPDGLFETAVAVSEWFTLPELPDYWQGVIPFDFVPAVPVNLNGTYHLAAETENYAPSTAYYLAAVLDWPDDVYTAAASTRRGAQIRLLGYQADAADPEDI